MKKKRIVGTTGKRAEKKQEISLLNETPVHTQILVAAYNFVPYSSDMEWMSSA